MAGLLTGGWLMGTFPILIFLGLALAFAIADRTDSKGPVLERMEYLLLAFGISFGAYAYLRGHSITIGLIAAISYTLVFTAHAWVRQTLGGRSGKITIVIFWLAMEYVFMKLNPGDSIFLADALIGQNSFTRWTIHTGYLGSSLWILCVNVCWYQAFLRDKEVHWVWLVAGVLFWVGPASYSYWLSSSPITRQDMINLYQAVPEQVDVTYLARGEFVVRTAAWLAALILLFTIIRTQTNKR